MNHFIKIKFMVSLSYVWFLTTSRKLKSPRVKTFESSKKLKTQKLELKKEKRAKEDKEAGANKNRAFWQIEKRHLPHRILFLELIKIFSPSAQDSWWNRKTLGEMKKLLVKSYSSWWNAKSLGEIEFHQDKNYPRNMQHITPVYWKFGLDLLLKNWDFRVFCQTGILQKIGTLTIPSNTPCPKNWDFHRNSFHVTSSNLDKPAYLNKNNQFKSSQTEVRK